MVKVIQANKNYSWYAKLKKPAWAPPSWLFGPVWSVLYLIIAVTFGFVFFKAWQGQLPRFIVISFIINLISNLIFTPLQFGLRNNLAAAIDIFIVLLSLVVSLSFIYPFIPLIAWLLIPYLLWVSFATVLQLTVTYLNYGQK
ncbi:MAG: tryptophan-rich sensory protein [candidate division WWE3 bacterium]|nr:tryptophan-rich sensory protein [candidate division WWE3 bacterium]